MISVAIRLSELERGHERFLGAHSRMLTESLSAAGVEAQREVMANPGFNPGTGALQRATETRIIRTASGRVLRVQNRKAYAAAIDQGAKPHVIVPRRGKFLRFIGSNGRTVFARRVKHPGNKPYRFLSNAATTAGRFLRSELERGMRRVAASL